MIVFNGSSPEPTTKIIQLAEQQIVTQPEMQQENNSSSSDNDEVCNTISLTALRRLNYKSGRHAKTRTTSVPKIIVMGSSTASTTTDINTSTESASTLITNITTDTSETFNSLDFGDASGTSEPLLSSLDEPNLYSTSVGSDQEVTEIELKNIKFGNDDSIAVEHDEEESSLTIEKRLSVSDKESPLSPNSARILGKTETKFTYNEASNYLKVLNQKEKNWNNNSESNEFPDNKQENMNLKYFYEISKNENYDPNSSSRELLKKQRKYKKFLTKNHVEESKPNDKLHETNNEIMNELKHEQNDLTIFPFDREAIDYQLLENEYQDFDKERTKFDNSNDDASKQILKENYKIEEFNDDIFKQYAILSQEEDFLQNSNETTKKMRKFRQSETKQITPDAFAPQTCERRVSVIMKENVKETHKFEQINSKFDQLASKLTDLSTHFSSSGICNNNNSSSSSNNNYNNNSSDNADGKARSISIFSNLLKISQGDAFKSTETKSKQQNNVQQKLPTGLHQIKTNENQNNSDNKSAINVTSNPMETAICTHSRATIVVQQPSLSLDNSIETILLTNENDFIGVEKGKGLTKKKDEKDDNVKQLLEVTNTLTLEELKDFEMRYGSPHHCRSQSVKTPGSRASGRPNQLTLPPQRNRVASMPNTGVEKEYYRLRHFSITGKGVVNRGDSVKSRRSRSNISVASSNSSNEPVHTSSHAIQVITTKPPGSLASSRESSTSNPGCTTYKILMLGGAAVGKSSLVSQFMTSEYLHAYDTSIDDESGEKAVSVLLNGEESELIFIDHSGTENLPESHLSSSNLHGYCVIYSSADRCSFNFAEESLQTLWKIENISQKAVILVGNKADLARSRVVSSDEGKAMATSYDCKFIETSVGINHNVDELLVGLLSQIRLKLENPEKSRDLFRKRSSRRSKRRACSPLGEASKACLSANGSVDTSPIGPPKLITDNLTSGSANSSPRKYRGSRTSTSLKVKGLLGRVWARDSKSKSCENLHVL